ncbi:MAG: hypothetical protein MK212_15180 [Saprospiraceae bacterium]|nr:hypothetical protein [Saprospiraceae bacterium]
MTIGKLIFIFIWSIWTTYTPLCAQRKLEKKYPPKTREIILQAADTLTKVHIFIENPSIKVKESKTYHWCHHNQIFKNVGGWSGKLLHGKFEQFYGDDALFRQGLFKEGLKEGLWQTWYTNGELQLVERWKKGILQGSCEKYDKNGQLVETIHYQNGKLHGKVQKYVDGLPSQQILYRNGKEKEEKIKVDKVKTPKEPKKKKDEPEQKTKPKKEKKGKNINEGS